MALNEKTPECAVRSPCRDSASVIAIATLYLTLQGTAVVAANQRRWVDPHWFRGMSYFMHRLELGQNIGNSWLEAILPQRSDFQS